MRYSVFFLSFLIYFSSVSFSYNTDNIIEIQIISGKSSKTYYTIFSDTDNSFIFYDALY